MSQKGNCWDNAPMETFWGKMKQEWLNGQKSKTRAEAKAKVFEYIMIFYNRKRLHASLTEPSSLRKKPDYEYVHREMAKSGTSYS